MLIDKVNEKYRELRDNMQGYHASSFDERINNLSEEKKANYVRQNKISFGLFLFIGIISLLGGGGLTALMAVGDLASEGAGLVAFVLIGAIVLYGFSIFGFVYSVKLIKRSKIEIYTAYLKAEDKRQVINSKNEFSRNAEDIVIDEYFKSINFSYTQKIHIVAVKGKWQYIFINSAGKQFKYLNLENDADVTVNFNDIVSYEIFEDGKEVVKGKAGEVLLGGLLFGVTGMLVAQNTQREIEKPITSLKLVIRLNNFSQPQIVINFIDNNLDFNAENYKATVNAIYENLRLIYSNLEIIKHNGSQSPEPQVVVPQKQNDLKDELVKLKELLDSGLITQEEFDAKKKQLLGL